MMACPPGFLVTRKAAEIVGYSKSSLDQMRMQGRGPAFVRVGTRIFYQRGDLDAWARGQRVDPAVAKPEAAR